MNELDPKTVADLVRLTQGVALTPESAQRIAKANISVRRTLDAVACGSLFDTEPAQFDRELSRLGGREPAHG